MANTSLTPPENEAGAEHGGGSSEGDFSPERKNVVGKKVVDTHTDQRCVSGGVETDN